MKKLLLLILSISLINAGLEDNAIDTNGKPTPAILELLSTLNITHDGTLETIVAATQKEQPVGFLRANGKERWQLDQVYSDEQKKLILTYAQKLGMVAEIAPSKKEYDYAVLLGATVSRVRMRLSYMVKQWNKGVRWKKMVLLAGERPLDKNIESEQELYNAQNGFLEFKDNWQKTTPPLTESEMMGIVLAQSKLPQEWEHIDTQVVSVPMHSNGSRPTTIDTIKAWLAGNPTPGTIMSTSNQPYIGYQDAVFQSQLPDSFSLETVGPQDNKDNTPEVLVDTIARWLYAVKNLVSKK